MTSHCNRPTTIIPLCLRPTLSAPASLGPQTISRMPKAWVEAPLLPVESTFNFGSLKDAANWFCKLLKEFSNLFKDTNSSTINDHQSKSISSTYDTTSDMMQNHWLLWYCCASTNSSWTSKIFLQNLSFTCSFSLTFQVSAHLQCLIQCLHCPSKELCVDVLAWMNLWMNPKVTSADVFPKWWHCGSLDVSESVEMGKPIYWEWNVWLYTLSNLVILAGSKMQVESHCLHHLANLNKMQDAT